MSALALVLVLGVGWELYSGVAIHKTGGPSHLFTLACTGLRWSFRDPSRRSLCGPHTELGGLARRSTAAAFHPLQTSARLLGSRASRGDRRIRFRIPTPLHGWREFAGEVGVIVLGVLIALGAQQVAEDIGWRQKVDAAVADMKNELGSGDGPEAYERITLHDCVATHLDKVRAAVEQGDRLGSRKLIDQFWVPNRTWDSLARDAANTADVAAHMPHERMLQYRIAYEVVPDMQRLAEKELGDLGRFRALPTSGGQLTTIEKLSEIEALEALKVDNDTFKRESTFLLLRLRMMGVGLSRRFVEHHIRAVHAHYGACVTVPHLQPNSSGQTVLD